MKGGDGGNGFNSRVGSSGELLPLIEPDMQISSIRLTDTRHGNAHARR